MIFCSVLFFFFKKNILEECLIWSVIAIASQKHKENINPFSTVATPNQQYFLMLKLLSPYFFISIF